MTDKNKTSLRLVIFWGVLGTLGMLSVIPYSLAITPKDKLALIPIPLPVLLVVQLVPQIAILFLLCWLGLKMGASIGLGSPLVEARLFKTSPPNFSKKGLLLAPVFAILGCLLVLGLDQYVFLPNLPKSILSQIPSPAKWKGLLASFYGGITEELLLRLFVMTLFAWLLWRLTKKEGGLPGSAIMWSAIILAALLFGAGHLPATAGIWPLTSLVITRALVLNGILGVGCGYLYWKFGLEYAIGCHFIADIIGHVLLP